MIVRVLWLACLTVTLFMWKHMDSSCREHKYHSLSPWNFVQNLQTLYEIMISIPFCSLSSHGDLAWIGSWILLSDVSQVRTAHKEVAGRGVSQETFSMTPKHFKISKYSHLKIGWTLTNENVQDWKYIFSDALGPCKKMISTILKCFF